jgi:tryptophan synthase alpha chain
MSESPRIMAHMVAFSPDRAGSLEVARGLAESGSAYLEVQFPFSDPTADGPDIQRACGRALEAGFTMSEGFRLVAEICSFAHQPLFVMSYANLLFTRGVQRFLAECKESGARGVIVPDLPPDYDEGLFALASGLGLVAMPVMSPSMKEKRLARVGSLRPECIYATLRTGTTGPSTALNEEGRAFLARCASLSPGVKVFGGFGISSREQVMAFEPLVHAVVVGSALVREVARGTDPRRAVRSKMEELMGRPPARPTNHVYT